MTGESFDDFQAELIKDFLLESSEGLDTFDQDLLVIEKGTCDSNLLNQVFRVVHTIKGTAGCLGFSRIESIAHTGENVLSLMREGELRSSPDIADALLKLSDALRAMLDVIETSGSDEGAGDYSDLKSVLDAIKNGEVVQASPPAQVEATPAKVIQETEDAWGLFGDEPEPEESPIANETSSDGGQEAWGLFGDEVTEPAGAQPTQHGDGTSEGGESMPWGLFGDEPEVAEPEPSAAPVPVAPAEKVAPVGPSAAIKGESIANASVRVDVELLDNLMNMVGELVLSRNQLLQLSHRQNISQAEVSGLSQRFNQVTTELQQGIMKTRMQQIGTVWGKYPRIVRDLASDLGKRVDLETFGADTELDRTIIEAIKDPLTHIIRNAVDHGIEAPAVRVSKGKPEVAQLLMRAFHEGGQVNIEIVDDGAGIDGNKICGKALEKGLITVEEAARFSEREKINLIFLPGFSTAEKLSNVSGRGVGMDVVKTNIEKIGGSVDIHSICGEGTTLRIRIPLTLAIVAALVVKSGKQRFAIPQVSLVELVRIKSEDIEHAIETVYDAPVFRLRGQLLPLVFLDKFLNVNTGKSEVRSSLTIAVLRADRQSFGLVVDEVSDTEEIVVKPLGKQLRDIPVYAGATIMGDGSVAIILDAVGVAARAGVLSASQKGPRATSGEADENADQALKESLILFSLPGWERLAVPLESAERLEEFPRTSIKVSGGVESVLYRGGIMKLLRLSRLLGSECSSSNAQTEQVIVYRNEGKYLGLVVGSIRDIVEEVVNLQNLDSRSYIRGSAIIDGCITELVDVDSILISSGLRKASLSA